MVRRSLGKTWKRLANMGAPEISTRLRQELDKRLEWIKPHFGIDHTESLPLRAVPGSFLFSPDQIPAIISTIRQQLPQAASTILEEADLICKHQFRLLGLDRLDYGERIDWHRDAFHNISAPRKPWFKINYFDPRQVGDPKIIWELNRHQHLVTLAKAYRFTPDPGYTREIFDQWYSWREQDPYSVGINWSSSLEVAFRSLSWLWVSALLENCSAAPPEFARDHLKAQSLAGRYIERFLSTYSSPNTHLLGEAVGLFFIGTVCTSLARALHWQQLGWKIILQEAMNQVRRDGFHFEQSTYYHVYALDFFIHARMLAARNNIPIPEVLDDAIQRMLEALASLSQAGPPPRFGDDDGGRVFDSSRNLREHLLDPLPTGAILFGRGDFKASNNVFTEEALWLLGPDAGDRFAQIEPASSSRSSQALTSSGFYVMASAEPVREQVVIDAGPQGAHSAGHGHADALSLHLSLNGKELLADPGTFQYGGDGAGRSWFRSTRAHNTLEIDGHSQAEISGPFSWNDLPQVNVERWLTTKNFDVFVGAHHGYQRLVPPAVHRRWVIYFKPHWWIVRDQVLGEGNHTLDIAWHLAPQSIPSHTADLVRIIPTADSGWKQESVKEQYSPAYGRSVVAGTIRFRYSGALPAELATLLIANNDTHDSFVSFLKSNPQPGVAAYQSEAAKALRGAVFGAGGQSWTSGDWASDAELLCYHIDGDGLHSVLLCNASFAEWGSQELISPANVRRVYEWERRSGALHQVTPEPED